VAVARGAMIGMIVINRRKRVMAGMACQIAGEFVLTSCALPSVRDVIGKAAGQGQKCN
jgi:hypothetical protein